MPDYIPPGDSAFNVWQGNTMNQISSNLIAWFIADKNFQDLQTLQTKWSSAYLKASNKQNRTSADVQDKNDARYNYEKAIRSFLGEWITFNSHVTDADRERMGLTVRKETRTPVPVPATRPIATVDFSIRQQHTVAYVDEANGRSKAKPTGVHGCEIWVKVGGEAPKSASELSYKGTCTASPYTVSFDGDDTGKIAYYWIRWINNRGEHGPWSAPFSAMIVG
ncbi:MAG: hypothetical protein H6Q17_1737 [Bacteroidetes bacterium]|jgi:hypothetical protein|nr:hypothetical protein [Bacteroidota bacterium]